jgi:anti-sigma-K factor RskA
MNKSSTSHEQQLDEQLSEFADRVLSGGSEEGMEKIANEEEMAKLQKTVLLMKAVAQQARTNPEAKARIHERLTAEWRKTRQVELKKPKTFNWNWNSPHIAFAGGFIALIMIGIATLFIPTGIPLTAAANGLQSWSLFLIVLGIGIIFLLFWLNRRKQ